MGTGARWWWVDWVTASVALACACELAACKDEQQVAATQVVVSVASDLAVGTQLTRVDAQVRSTSGKQIGPPRSFELSRDPGEDEVDLPFSFTVEKGESDRFRLDVIGYGPLGPDGDLRPVVERKVIARFQARKTLLLKVFLGAACFDNLCAGSRTCYPERAAGVDAGECGDLPEPMLRPVAPSTENDGWTGKPDSGASGGVAGKDGGREDGGSGASGGGGRGGDGGDDPDAAAGSDAGEDAGMNAGSGGSAGTTAGSGGSAGSAGSAGTSGSGGSAGSSGSGSTSDECVPTGERAFPQLAADHVQAPLPSTSYNSRPPSSGQHCDAWSRWGVEYTPAKPLPACNWLHNLEHGSIILLYNCPGGCPDEVQLLRDVMKDAPLDPDCSEQGIKRLLITPYADMEAKIAATTWGYTWTSSCIDGDTKQEMIDFIVAHWGNNASDKSPEPGVCGHGSVMP